MYDHAAGVVADQSHVLEVKDLHETANTGGEMPLVTARLRLVRPADPAARLRLVRPADPG